MNGTSIRRMALPGIAAITLVSALSACGAANETSTSSGDAGSKLSGSLSGAGSSAQAKAEEAWATGFQGSNAGVTVNYDPVGSGDGRKQFIAKGVSFAGSDSYLSDKEGDLTNAKKRCDGEDPIEVPGYVSPIAVVFNVDGVKDLNLDAKTIAGIFDGKIKKWNDPAIASQNKGAKLPDLAIDPVHRSDDSGTTHNFTDYLQKASGAWSFEASDTFPVKGGEAAEGTSGVISAVTGGKGTIGYADASAAKGLSIAKIKVGNQYVAPNAEGAAAAVENAKPVAGRPAVDLAVDIDRTSTDPKTYPLVLVSYLIACQHYADKNEAGLVKGYLSYAVSADGQKAAAENAGSAPLSDAVSAKATAVVSKIAAK